MSAFGDRAGGTADSNCECVLGPCCLFKSRANIPTETEMQGSYCLGFLSQGVSLTVFTSNLQTEFLSFVKLKGELYICVILFRVHRLD